MLTFNRILFPTDFSDVSLHACKKLLSLVTAGANIEFLHVIDFDNIYAVNATMFTYYSDLEDLVQKNAKESLQEFTSKIQAPKDVKITTKIERGNCARTICEYAEKGFDLVALGTHGRSGLKHVMMGSIAERVVQSCNVPVLSLRNVQRE